MFLLANAVGGISGGYAAERLGSKRVMGVTLALATPVLIVAVWNGGPLQLAALVAGGLLLAASHAVNVSLAQVLAPDRAGTIAAFMVGVAMGLAGLLMPVVGGLADVYGVETGLTAIAFGAILASFLVLPLQSVEPRGG